MTFTTDERALLARLADVLIPPGESALSAAQADVAGRWLDAVLAARPDLAGSLKAILANAGGRDPAIVVSAWAKDDPAAFGTLAEISAGAYFMNPSVREAIGYTGQGPHPIDPHPDYLDDGLLQSVIDRGPIYRPTPP